MTVGIGIPQSSKETMGYTWSGEPMDFHTIRCISLGVGYGGLSNTVGTYTLKRYRHLPPR